MDRRFNRKTFGDFELIFDTATDCFNATHLCQTAARKFSDWLKQERSIRLFKYYKCKVYEVKHEDPDIAGKYIPMKLMLDISSWLSIPFYQQCSEIINTSLIDNPPECSKRLLLLKRNDPHFPYYIVKAKHTEVALSRQKHLFPEIDTLLNIPLNPDKFNKARNNLKLRGAVFHLREVSLEKSKLSEKDLIEMLSR